MIKRVMLVEDNLDERLLIKRKAERLNIGLEIIEAGGGQEAIDQLENMHPNALPRLIFLDLKMPKVDGHQVLRWVREHDATKNIPVVIFSVSDNEDDIAKSYELGANSYVIKELKEPQCLSVLCGYWATVNQVID